ncbi:hypothetical protein A7982_13703 [Minicystis rosea]|nr:hypothetical protein A7982_13703 [Minicystis rosea]
MTRPRAVLVAAIVSTMSLAADPVAADEPQAQRTKLGGDVVIVFRKSACALRAFDEASFSRLLAIEVGAKVESIEADAPAPPADDRPILIRLEGDCGGRAALVLVIERPRAGGTIRESVALDDLQPAARPRALALKTAEVLRVGEAAAPPGAASPASVPDSAKVEATATLPAPAGPSAPAKGTAPTARTEVPPSFLLSGGVSGRYFFGSRAFLFGGAVGAAWVFGARRLVRLRADVGGWYGSGKDPFGSAGLSLMTGALGLGLGGGVGIADLEAGPRLEIGWAHVWGRPGGPAIQAGSGDAPITIVSLAATAHLRLGARVWPTLDLALGHVITGILGEANTLVAGAARSVTGIGGVSAAARLGIAFGL